MCRLDIVIPVYNEGENIIQVLEALLQSVQIPFRVLICYDHETDTTLEVVQKLQNNLKTQRAKVNPNLMIVTAAHIIIYLLTVQHSLLSQDLIERFTGLNQSQF